MPEPTGTTRRRLIQAGLLGAGATTLAPAAVAGPPASGGHPDYEDPRFTLAVIPDTQYLFDLDRGDRTPLDATVRYLNEHRRPDNIVFAAHLGDVTENGQTSEITEASAVLDRLEVPYSVLAGNHDIDSSTDDQRGDTPYLREFGAQRYQRMRTFRGATPDGYNTYHVFRAGGREWLLLAMDWRPSDGSFAWARQVIADHPRLPVILTIHDLVAADNGDGVADFSLHGQRVWDQLVGSTDQIFLTLNGHFWPPGRTVKKNAAGNDVHLHITNYQDRYYGGSAMIRLYRFDLARNTIDVSTISPWLLAKGRRNALERLEVELTSDVNRFSVPVDFSSRFAGFDPVPVRPARPAGALVIPATVAYWRFDSDDVSQVLDRSGRGNHLTRVDLPGTPAAAVRRTDDHHDDQPAHASLLLDGSKDPGRGGYFRTADGAGINAMTFRNGYTVEAFLKLHPDQDAHPWMGLVSRMGTGGQAGKTGGDPAESVATLSVTGGRGLQWAVWPLDRDDIWTNWGHEMPPDTWFHVAVVNDGRTSTMYVESSPVLRNPSTRSNGISTTGAPWLVGATTYDNLVEQGFYGWIGDVRITDRPLPVTAFLTA